MATRVAAGRSVLACAFCRLEVPATMAAARGRLLDHLQVPAWRLAMSIPQEWHLMTVESELARALQLALGEGEVETKVEVGDTVVEGAVPAAEELVVSIKGVTVNLPRVEVVAATARFKAMVAGVFKNYDNASNKTISALFLY